MHYFCTYILGRLFLAMVLQGTEVAMCTRLLIASCAFVFGIIFRIVASYFGGIVDICIVLICCNRYFQNDFTDDVAIVFCDAEDLYHTNHNIMSRNLSFVMRQNKTSFRKKKKKKILKCNV